MSESLTTAPSLPEPPYPYVQCDECGVMSFDLKRMGEIHECPRRGAFRLHTTPQAEEGEATVVGVLRESLKHGRFSGNAALGWAYARDMLAAYDKRAVILSTSLVALAEENKRMRKVLDDVGDALLAALPDHGHTEGPK